MRRASERDTRKLHGQADAVWMLIERESDCKCTEGFAENEDGDLKPVKACKSRLDHALRVARQAAGFERSSSGGNRNSDTPNPVLAAVQALELLDNKKHIGWKRHTDPEWWQERIMRNTGLISGALADMAVIVSELAKITATDPKDLGKNGQGTCPACDYFCSGAVDDRLISGFCDTDYRAWKRAGRPERSPWIQARRNQRHAESADMRTDAAQGIPVRANNTAVVCAVGSCPVSEPKPCDHQMKRLWSHGKETCMTCGADLDIAAS